MQPTVLIARAVRQTVVGIARAVRQPSVQPTVLIACAVRQTVVGIARREGERKGGKRAPVALNKRKEEKRENTDSKER